MGTYSKTAFDKEAKDLRDKRLLPFTQDKLSRVEITAQKQTYEFVKKGESEWQIVKPKAMRADSTQTDDLVRQLNSAQMDLSGVQDEKEKRGGVQFGADAGDCEGDRSGRHEDARNHARSRTTHYRRNRAVDGIYKGGQDGGRRRRQAG